MKLAKQILKVTVTQENRLFQDKCEDADTNSALTDFVEVWQRKIIFLNNI